MSRMRLVSLDTAGTAAPDATDSGAHSMAPAPSTILLTVRLAEDTQQTVFVTDLNTEVARGVLTATGTAHIPGHGRDTFTAVVWAIDTSDNLMLTIAPGSPRADPLCFVADVSHLLANKGGAGAATDYLSSLLNHFVSGLGP